MRATPGWAGSVVPDLARQDLYHGSVNLRDLQHRQRLLLIGQQQRVTWLDSQPVQVSWDRSKTIGMLQM